MKDLFYISMTNSVCEIFEESNVHLKISVLLKIKFAFLPPKLLTIHYRIKNFTVFFTVFIFRAKISQLTRFK